MSFEFGTVEEEEGENKKKGILWLCFVSLTFLTRCETCPPSPSIVSNHEELTTVE